MAIIPSSLLPGGSFESFLTRDLKNLPSSDSPHSWQSITGVDMTALFRFEDVKFADDADPLSHYKVFAELQTVSVSATRSVHPVRCLGESSARAYTRGARTFAGSLIFTMFSKDPFEEVARLDVDHETYDGREPFAIDQIPEFDIIITGINERGAISRALIGGVTLTNYGTTFSIHDIYTEVSYTYVARWYIPMTADIKAFDRVRRLALEPLAKAGSNAAEVQLAPGLTDESLLARKLLGGHNPLSSVGKFIREFKA